MEKIVKALILEECKKLIDRHYDYLFELDENIKRKSRRFGNQVTKNVLRPHYWQIHSGFDPFKVSTKKRINTYAYTLGPKLKDLSYKPQTSIIYKIPKLSGEFRELNVFQIPDSAISRFVYKSLLEKNVNLFSGYSYAYREDRNAHDAIHKIASDWKSRDRIYVAEFDFSKFFDRISHSYIWKILNSHGFLYTELEKHVIDVFLKSEYAEDVCYEPNLGSKRKQGIPQGTSISLFLANVACWELDNELEKIGVQFARYADDTLIWSNSYEQVVKAYDTINHFGKLMGVPINLDKSEGITLISDRISEELKAKSNVCFLGYDISLKRVSISTKRISHIKEELSYIIYENLLQAPKRGIFNLARINLIDWDYVTALAQVRRYLYGGLNDKKLRQFRLGVIRQLRFRGVMSYYPLVNDEEQLRKLDGWLIHSLSQALVLRQKLWLKHQGLPLPGPSANWINDITCVKTWTHPSSNITYDFRIPSFMQINRAMKIGLKRGGINSVTNPKSRYYSDILKSRRFPHFNS